MPKGEKQLNEMSTMSKAREYVAFGRLVIASDLHETCIPTDDAAVYVKAQWRTRLRGGNCVAPG